LEKNAENSTIDNKLRIHWCASDERGFYGNQYVKTMKLTTLGKGITKVTGPIGNLLTAADISMGMYSDYNNYKKTGYTDCYHSAYATAGFVGGTVGGSIFVPYFTSFGFAIAFIPGAVIGGAVGGIIGSFCGSRIGENYINYLYGK
jgi:hypothetical protein